jgi:hypothetical protein
MLFVWSVTVETPVGQNRADVAIEADVLGRGIESCGNGARQNDKA